jgi:ankyrin repeat protein
LAVTRPAAVAAAAVPAAAGVGAECMPSFLRALHACNFDMISALLLAQGGPATVDLSGATTQCGVPLLTFPSFYGHLDLVRLLLRHKASAEAVCPRGVSPLVVACTRGHAVIAAELIAAKADVNRAAPATPLMRASEGRFPAVVRLLLDSKAEPNPPRERASSRADTPLHAACRDGCAEIVAALLARGASDACIDKHKRVPLHLACFGAHVAAVSQLLRWPGGAATVARLDMRRDTALHFLCRGAQDDADLGGACGESRVVTVARMLLAVNRDLLRYLNAQRLSPLSVACQAGHLPLIKFLLAEGASVDDDDDGGDVQGDGGGRGRGGGGGGSGSGDEDGEDELGKPTPLCTAINARQCAVVRVLLDRKASLDRLSSAGCVRACVLSGGVGARCDVYACYACVRA